MVEVINIAGEQYQRENLFVPFCRPCMWLGFLDFDLCPLKHAHMTLMGKIDSTHTAYGCLQTFVCRAEVSNANLNSDFECCICLDLWIRVTECRSCKDQFKCEYRFRGYLFVMMNKVCVVLTVTVRMRIESVGRLLSIRIRIVICGERRRQSLCSLFALQSGLVRRLRKTVFVRLRRSEMSVRC